MEIATLLMDYEGGDPKENFPLMAKNKTAKEQSELRKISTWVSILTLVTGWFGGCGFERQLQGVKDSVLILAMGQSDAVRSTIDKALAKNEPLSPGEVRSAQQIAKALMGLQPKNADTWVTVADVASYRARLVNVSSEIPKPPCLTMPIQHLNATDADPGTAEFAQSDPGAWHVGPDGKKHKYGLPGDEGLENCSLDLDAFKGDPRLVRLVLTNVDVAYSGGRLPALQAIIFRNCRFHFEIKSAPTEGGQILLAGLIESDPREAQIDINGVG